MLTQKCVCCYCPPFLLHNVLSPGFRISSLALLILSQCLDDKAIRIGDEVVPSVKLTRSYYQDSGQG